MYITLIKYIYIYIFTNFLCIYSLSTRDSNKEPDFSEPNYRKLLLKETAIEISSLRALLPYKSGNRSEETFPEECTRLSHRAASTAEIDPSSWNTRENLHKGIRCP